MPPANRKIKSQRASNAPCNPGISSEHDLPNSNQLHQAGISHCRNRLLNAPEPAVAMDRRAIPPSATESRWLGGGGHAIRRGDWARAGGRGGGGGGGGLLFLPGRGDSYEKYLETLDRWHAQGWRVTAVDWRGQAGSGRLGMDA